MRTGISSVARIELRRAGKHGRGLGIVYLGDFAPMRDGYGVIFFVVFVVSLIIPALSGQCRRCHGWRFWILRLASYSHPDGRKPYPSHYRMEKLRYWIDLLQW
jgi:hypothetical protein